MSNGDPCPTNEQLESYAIGTLAESDASAIERHLQQCVPCFQVVRGILGDTPLTQDSEFSHKQVTVPMKIVAEDSRSAQGPPPPPGNDQNSTPKANYSFLLPPASADEIGRLGNYRILRELGRGAMGLVFLAEDIALCRRVALKVMKPDVDDNFRPWPRFLREARTMAGIKHPNLVTVYQVGQEAAVVYIAMEYLEGNTLDDWLARSPQPEVGEILRIAGEIVSGLAAIHANGLVHRDIKPGNIWIEAPRGNVKILDFGLVLPVKEDARLTSTGITVGTPAYMSPEQARGEKLDARSDLFSLGCVLYLLATGNEPFRGESMMARLTALAVDDPPPIQEQNPLIPRALSLLIMKLLAKDPKDRPPSLEYVEDRLQLIQDSRTDVIGAMNSSTVRRARARARLSDDGETTTATARRRRRRGIIEISAVAIFLLVIAGLLLPRSGFFAPAANSDRRSVDGRDVRNNNDDEAIENPGQVYLADLVPVGCEEWPHLFPTEVGPMINPYRRIIVNGQRFSHGIPMHASPNGLVSLTFSLRREFREFHAKVALNDTAEENRVQLIFRVVADEKAIWTSKPISRPGESQTCDQPLPNVDLLRLEVTSRGPVKGSHGVWIDPYLTR